MKTSAPLRTLPLFFFLLSFSLAAAFGCSTLGCARASGESAFGEANADGGLVDGGPSAFTISDDAGPLPEPATLASPPPDDDAGEDADVRGPSGDDASTASDDGASAAPPPTPASSPPFDAGEAGACTHALGSGDLIIVELMIESTTGTGDHGEWVEVMSTLDCAADLNGLSGNVPTGAKVVTFEIDSDVWIPARGTFVIADSTNPAVNHELPGLVVPWSGQPGDVLRNEGATVTLWMNSDIVDSVTSPDLKLTPGVSIAFPHDCPLSIRPTWSAWQPSNASWFPAFRGTPNAPNNDIHCPVLGDE